MAVITVQLTTEEEEERGRRFQVHKNYLGALQQYVASTYEVGEDRDFRGLLARQRETKGFQRLQRKQPADPDALRRYLLISWSSEAQLRVHEGVEAAIIPYANAWAPVHSYYSIYMMCVAWLSAQDHANASDHSAVLSAIANQVVQRKLFPSPWSVVVEGCPDIKEPEWTGLPKGADPRGRVELLSNPSMESFWPRFCKMLETTRSRKLKGRYAEWCKQNNRQRTFRAEKRSISKNLPATTLFDFFWRLRVRSNYQDVELFLLSNVSFSWQRQFYDAIRFTTEATSLLLENLIIQRAGRDVYESALEDFRQGGGQLAETIAGRRRSHLLD